MLREKNKGPLVIELRGVEFENKGAELMLYSILNAVRKRWPNAIFVMKHWHKAPRKKLLPLNIYTKTYLKKFGLNFGKLLDFLPKKIRRKLNFVSEEEIDLILDGSGFAYGDFWGVEKLKRNLASPILKWKQNEKKVVLLPQAMGAFEDTDIQKEMEIVLAHADLVFPRDQYSLAYVKKIPGDYKNVFRMPDFTNLMKGKLPSSFQVLEKQVAIIPNHKLIESASFLEKEYIGLLLFFVENIQEKGKNPFFLIHAGKEDLELAKKVNEISKREINIMVDESPVNLKGIIGSVDSVITSRFHGLVSALSQAIPCLTLGWSHKYRALMEEYNFSEGLMVKENLSEAELLKKLDLILEPENNEKIHNHLLVEAEKQKKLSREMWDLVFSLYDDSEEVNTNLKNN